MTGCRRRSASRLNHRRRGLLDRAPRHVDARPVVPGAQLARERHFLGDCLAVDILIVVVMRLEAEQPVLANLHDPLRAGIEPDHQRPRQLLHMPRHLDAGHQRNVAGLHAAIGEIDRGRRLRCARDADQHDIGLLQTFEMLAVIVQHGVVERIDALEIFGVESVLCADAMRGLGTEIGSQQLQDRPEDRKTRQAQLAAVLFEPLQQFIVEQRIENDARRFLDLRQHAIELLLGPHQRVDVLDRQYLGVLRGRRARDGGERLTGRVGHEVKVEIAASALWHNCGTTCEFMGRRPRPEPRAQAHRRQTGSNCPHCRCGDIIATQAAGKHANVHHSVNNAFGIIASRADKWGFEHSSRGGALVTHRPGITCIRVDGMWMPMYELNQRSKNHNKSL